MDYACFIDVDVKDDHKSHCLNIEDVDKQAVKGNSATLSDLERGQLSDNSLKGAWILATA